MLVLVLAYQLARITWALVPGPPLDAPAPVINPDTIPRPPESPAVDIQGIVDAHLFGKYVEHAPQPVVQILQAPETELDLLLKATVSAAREDTLGAAVIASAGIERTYTVNKEIEGAGGAVLHAIHFDRVILNHAGQLQTLRLPRSNAADNRLTVLTAASGLSAAPGQAAGLSPTVAVPTLRTTLSEHASRLSRIVHAAPHVEQGRMTGFRLNPADDPASFEALGLEPGDVVTEINGTALTQPGQALEVFERLGESTQANVTLRRNGRLQVLSIDTTLTKALKTDP